MKLKFKKDLSNKQIAAIAVIGVTSPYIVFFGFMISTAVIPKAPEQHDFTQFQNQVEKIDLVDFDYIDDYAVLETLDPLSNTSVLNDLSNLWFHNSGYGDPPGFGGKCILLSFKDDSHRIVCSMGYAYFNDDDEDLHFFTTAWRYIKSEEYKTLLERYFTSKLDY
ncbi:MAG: hypothetical protein HGB31_04060 [Erysipelotrichaceae bacterium]|nr:hypothetical protein [Erysipelotrichaceae bacterium]